MNMIRSEMHKIYPMAQNIHKYDKRYILDDRISTLPYGHYLLRK